MRPTSSADQDDGDQGADRLRTAAARRAWDSTRGVVARAAIGRAPARG